MLSNVLTYIFNIILLYLLLTNVLGTKYHFLCLFSCWEWWEELFHWMRMKSTISLRWGPPFLDSHDCRWMVIGQGESLFVSLCVREIDMNGGMMHEIMLPSYFLCYFGKLNLFCLFYLFFLNINTLYYSLVDNQ